MQNITTETYVHDDFITVRSFEGIPGKNLVRESIVRLGGMYLISPLNPQCKKYRGEKVYCLALPNFCDRDVLVEPVDIPEDEAGGPKHTFYIDIASLVELSEIGKP